MTGRPPGRPAAGRPSRRARVVATARELFAAHGFTGTGIDDIGAAAGVTGPAVYHYFRTKHELFAAVLDELTAEVLAATDVALAGAADPPAAVDAMARVFVDHVFDHRGLIAGFVAERGRFAGDERAAPAVEHDLVDRWAGALVALRPGLDRRTARAVAFAAQWLVYSVCVTPPRDTPARRARYVTLVRAVLTADLPGEGVAAAT